MSVTKKAILLIFIILFIDQVSKIYIKLNFVLGESVFVFDWFRIYFIENNGMAFGMEIIGKLFLTIFRIIAVGGLGYFIYYLIKKQARQGFILAVALLLAGAAGNIIDSIFYGMLFSDSHGQLATFLPEGGGYAPLFYGKVVDMLYFPIWKGTLPEWLPFVGGNYFTFFNAIFNIADMAISTGVGILIVFNKRAFGTTDKEEVPSNNEVSA